jgi:hypothetical protein
MIVSIAAAQIFSLYSNGYLRLLVFSFLGWGETGSTWYVGH